MAADRQTCIRQILEAIEYGNLPREEILRRLQAIADSELSERTITEAGQMKMDLCTELQWRLMSGKPFPVMPAATEALEAVSRRAEKARGRRRPLLALAAVAAAVVLAVNLTAPGMISPIRWFTGQPAEDVRNTPPGNGFSARANSTVYTGQGLSDNNGTIGTDHEHAMTDPDIEPGIPGIMNGIDEVPVSAEEDPVAGPEPEKKEAPAAGPESEEAEALVVSTETEEAEVPVVSTESEETEAPVVSTESEETEAPIASTESEEAEAPVVSTETEEAEAPVVSTESEETEAPIASTESEEAEAPVVSTETEEAEAPVVSTETEEAEAPVFIGFGSEKAKTPGDNSPVSDYEVGAYVTYGHYDGEPIEWLVLDMDEENHRAFLISRKVLDARLYNNPTPYKRTTWDQCDMRVWLNSEFLDTAFTPEEQAAILETEVDNSFAQQEPSDNFKEWVDTRDKIYFLSYAEVFRYFSSNSTRMAAATDIALRHGLRHSLDEDKNRVGRDPAAYWTLRSPFNVRLVFVVSVSGEVMPQGGATSENFGVRPVLWLDLSAELPDVKTGEPEKIEETEPAEETASDLEVEEIEDTPVGTLTEVRVGDTVILGSWEQDADIGNGPEPIEWIVLETDGSKALLISRYGLVCGPFADTSSGQTWANSVLRGTLNTVFYQEFFTEEDQRAVLLTEVDESEAQQDPAHPSKRTGPSTKDRIFVLSYAEMAKYFPSPADRRCYVTKYVRQNANHSQTKMGENYTCWYWLRTPAYSNSISVVDMDGSFGTCVLHDSDGVARPSCWVDLSKLPEEALSGTEETTEEESS